MDNSASDIIEKVKYGYDFFRQLQSEYGRERGRFYIFLFSTDKEINHWTIYYLPFLRQEMNVTEFVIISPYSDLIKAEENNLRVPYVFKNCNIEDMSAVCTFFYCIWDGVYKKEKCRVVINGASGIKSDRFSEYIGYNGITKKEAVALSVFLFTYVPDEKEVENASEFVPVHRETVIDWDKYGCIRTEEAITFPEIIDKETDRLFHSGKITREDNIAVFSVTKTTRHIINKLAGYKIVAVLDNNKDLEGTLCEGVMVYTPEAFLEKKHLDDLKIIVPTKSYRDICEQLYKLGYHIDEQVFVIFVEHEQYGIKKFSEDIRRGEEIYTDIRKEFPSDRLYFLTFAGIGDAYLAGMYLKDRIRFDGVDIGVVIFITETCKRAFSILNHEAPVSGDYVIGNRDDAMKLLLYIKQNGYENLNVCNITHSYDLMDPGYLRGFKGLDFNAMTQIGPYRSPNKKSGVDVNKVDAGLLFETYNLKQGGTVLLAPYAKSAARLPDNLWSTLVIKLNDMGYDVCTNVSGIEEGIRGTVPLAIPIEQVYDFVERAGFFIGLRSGLCDLISHAKAKKIVLYNIKQAWGADYTLAFFGLENMGLADDDTNEIVIDTDIETTVEKVKSIIKKNEGEHP